MTYNEVLQSAVTVVVEFYATWCPHCQHMMPIVDEVKKRLGDTAKVYQFDIDQNQKLAEAQGVTSVPTFIVYRQGHEAWRYTGEMAASELLAKIENCISTH
ncbi:MAG: thioredoxin family protein [Bacteroidales bacterium]|nr:thioredoxin family protein [Bacteroidales bacterium]